MRTTIRLDDHLLTELKLLAARTGRTLTRVIEDALRETLARQQRPPRAAAVQLHTFAGNGLLPGVDLNDSVALRELMDRPDAPA